jgi:hypothetical protein
MSYRTTATGASVLAGSTSAVLVTGGLLAQLNAVFAGGWTYAANSSGTFTFHLVSGGGDQVLSPTQTLTIGILDGSLLGDQVLVDTGGNKWMLGTLVGDGNSFVSGGTAVASTARAVPLANVSGYSPPPWTRIVTGPASSLLVPGTDPSSETFALLGTSVDGHTWFSNARLGAFYGTGLATVAGITAGAQAFVEMQTNPSVWRLLTL